MACVVTTSKEFKNLMNQYGASMSTMELAIKSYLDKTSLEEYNPNDQNFKDYIDNYFKLGENNKYFSEKEYDKALEIWNSLQTRLNKSTSEKEALEFASSMNKIFGEENVIVYETNKGEYKVNVGKPINTKDVELSSEQDIIQIEDSLQKSKELVNRIIADSKKNIKFNPTDHTYTVNGKKADFSASEYAREGENVNMGLWSLPSSLIGNTADIVVRDFFMNSLKESYPNLNNNQLNNLKDDLTKLRKYFDNKFGENNYEIVTTEFPIASEVVITNSKGEKETKIIAGTMDMFIYDNKGNFYIYDMKTSRRDIQGDKKYKYTRQLNIYKSILEASYPEIKGKIKELKIIQMNVGYPSPQYIDGSPTADTYNIKGDPNQLYLNDKPIQDSNEYSAPRLILDNDVVMSLIDLKELKFQDEFKSLTQEEQDLMSEETTTSNLKHTPYQQTEEEKQRTALFNSTILPAQERTFLAKSVMKMASILVNHLQQDSANNQKFFPNNMYSGKDFTKMTRRGIIDVVGINSLLNIVKNQYFDTENRLDVTDENVIKKLDLIYDNWGALIEAGKNHLMTLEGVTIERKYQSVKLDSGNDDVESDNDSGNLEEKPREYWQIGQRQISAKSGLSSDIRRAFERLPVLDESGKQLTDTFGYGIPLYTDSDVAVNSILDWVKDATTINEMENILNDLKSSYPWLNSIVNKIKDEPFRSQFFNNFRKDFTKYSIIIVEYDEKGNKVYKTQIINTKGATQTILEEITSAFKEGAMSNLIIARQGDIDGKGSVNIKQVEKLIKNRDELYNILYEASKTGSQGIFKYAIENSITPLTNLLNELGIHIKESTVKTALKQDLNKKQLTQTTINLILKDVGHILNTISEQKENKEYNPLLKGVKEGNVYGNYKNIIERFSKYIQDSIESSTYENGKLYYSFNTPSYLQGVITNLSNALGDNTKFENYIEENYGSYRWFKDNNDEWNNPWLELIAKSSDMRSGLQHKVQLSFESNKGKKTSYEDLSELGYTTSLLNEFFYDSHNKWAWYRVPILSDKPSSEFIRFKRYHTNYKRDITRGMKKVFNQEILRIKTVLERSSVMLNNPESISNINNFDAYNIIKNNSELSKKVKNKNKLSVSDLVKDGKLVLSGSGAEFKFLEMFNQNIIVNDNLGKMIIAKINDDFSAEDEIVLDSLFESQFEEYMNNIFELEKKNWKNIGLYDTEEVVVKKGKNQTVETRFKYVNHLGKTKADIDTKLEEYLWNDVFATTNIIQLTVTDLAYYKNVEDFQKRFAQIHSPTMKMNVYAIDYNGVPYSKDHLERTIYLKDFEIISDIIPQIKTTLYDKVEKGEITKFQADTILSKYGYSTTKDGKFVESKLEDDKIVLIPSEKINVADAQGYSSPTSYRKKMGMMGRWSTEMDEAYNKIKSGEWNGEDLNVIWQPLKPFVYSQIRKTSGVNTMSELKVPVQNKNSEYLLIMADAILRGNQKENKLSAIYEFMEESAYDNNNYNGRGIDTVQFESAVKSGLMGVININDATSKEEVKNILYNAVYTGNNKEYDNQIVHEIPFEDYGIQQEVPAHLVDNKQLMGTQMRILSISDISSDATFKIHGESETWSADKLRNEYQKLIAENIKESFDKLVKDFNLTGSRIEKNKAISKLLLEAMENDQKYGADLVNACSLNHLGEFNVPLSDPIQSIRIQQLMNSIIKSRINKQTISGGPVVQASVFGVSDDLNIVWKGHRGELLMTKSQWEVLPDDKRKHESFEEYLKNNQNSVAYFEVYMPIPSAAMEKSLTKEDGSIMSIEEALREGIINKEQLKAIGYRIPTEDKYSMAPLMIKGFLPKSAGEAIMLPKEITLLSGSDFDIDKMYIIVKDFLKSKKKINYDKIKDSLLKDETLKNMLKSEKTIAFTDNIERIIEEIDEGVVFDEGTAEMYVYDYIQENKSKFQEQHFYEKRRLTDREGRNNKIFDIQWSVLTNKDTTFKMFNPGSFDSQKKSARIITILKNPNNKYSYSELSEMPLGELNKLSTTSSGRNIIFPSTQVYLHKQNMTAAKLIGIFANNNTSHAFMSMQDIHLNLIDSFNFDNVEISNFSNNKLDKLLALDNKTLISKNIAGFLAASVDAVKDPVLNFINLNTFTANPAMVLARLGFDSDSIGLFLTQPIIEKITREYFKRSNEGYTSVDDIVSDELNFLENKYNIKPNVEDISTNLFTKEDLASNISKRAKGIVDSNSIAYQSQVLLLFQQLATIGQDLNTLTFLTKFNSVTNAVGPTIADTFVMRERYNKFIDKMSEPDPPFSKNAVNIIEESPILKAFYDATVADNGASQKIFEIYFPHYSSTFSNVLNRMRQTTKSNLDSKTINKLINDFIIYKLTIKSQEGSVFNSSFENRNHFINNFVKRFRREAAGIIDNELIDIITIKSRDKKVPVPVLQAKTGGYSMDVQERVKDAWSNLINNPQTKQLGIDLFFYNMFRSGFSFSPNTFMHLAPVDVKQAVEGYIDSIVDVEFNDNDVVVDEFLTMFRRNHSNDGRVVPTLQPSEKMKVSKSKNVRNQTVFTFNFTNDKNSINSILVSGNNNYAPVITYDDDVLIFNSSNKNSVNYILSTTLGTPNNFLEYDANDSAIDMKSAILSPIFDSQIDEYEPSNNSIKEDYFDNSIVINEDSALKIAIDRVLTPEEISELGEYSNEDKALSRFLEIMNRYIKEESSDKHKEQLKKLIEPFC